MSIIVYNGDKFEIESKTKPNQTKPIDMKTNIRKQRFEQGELSQQQLADMVLVSRQTIVAIERGNYSPSVKLALLLAEKLETTVEAIFELEDEDHA